MLFRFAAKHKSIILYALALAVLLFAMRRMEYRLTVLSHAVELYVGFIAVLFTALGIWLALTLAKPKVEVRTVPVEKEVPVPMPHNKTFDPDRAETDRLGISNRELEVLQLMAEGLSNREIAGRLFVSLNTVKTHASNLFEKMDVKRRTQAVDKAKRLNIIP